MSVLAADINDASITVLGDAGVVYREPGIALLDDDGLTTGNDALRVARVKPRRIYTRYWSELSTESLPDQRFRHLSAADLVSRQLEQLWSAVAGSGDRLVVAVPAYMDRESLGLLLGICDELELPLVAMVDAAVAATRRRYDNAQPVHVDVSLHSTLLTRVRQSGQAQAENTAVVDDGGLFAMYDAWIRAIAEAFVQQSRFDPLHTAETEQMLLDRMPTWLAAAATGGTVSFDIEYQGIGHHAEMDALEFIAVVAPSYQRIVSQLRTLCRADETPAIQLTDRAAQLPGLAEMLKARVGGEVFLLESGATARGLLARARDFRRSAQVSLVRQLPWDQSAVEVRAAHRDDGGRPTHVLFDNRAYAIDGAPLYLGTQSEQDERWIDLRQSMPGVSRRHCALELDNGQCVVRDYSRYGTFLNGHRLDGSAVLVVGDLLRVGTPGFELRLISVEDGHGA